MHRTKLKPFWALWTLLLGLALGGPSLAQPPADGKPPARTSQMVVSLNSTQRLQMSTKKRIAKAENPRQNVARVVADQLDPTSVLVTGLEAGSTRVTLTDADGAVEEVVITVQLFDIEYLKTILRQTVPTANLNPIPSANNTLILTGHVARAEDLDMALNVTRSVVGDRVLSALRIGGVMQVQLDVVVAQVSRSEVRRLSFEFINFGQKHVVANAMGGVVIPSTGLAGAFPGGPTITNAISAVNGAPINGFFAVFDPEQDFFGFLQALRDENLVKLQSFPKVVVMSGRQVSFLSGGEQAIPVPAGLGQVGVQFEEFGTRLNALPIVMGNGKIHLELEPEVSSLNVAFGTAIAGTVVPGRETQRLRTTVELESGQTLCIGGLIQSNVRASTTKLPILGDIPFLGAFFCRKEYNEIEEELVVLVTPHAAVDVTLPLYGTIRSSVPWKCMTGTRRAGGVSSQRRIPRARCRAAWPQAAARRAGREGHAAGHGGHGGGRAALPAAAAGAAGGARHVGSARGACPAAEGRDRAAGRVPRLGRRPLRARRGRAAHAAGRRAATRSAMSRS